MNDVFLGVDLGSTTSKAVLLDENERILGRGITNTRASYDVAVEVARREALDDALLRRVLPAGGTVARVVVHGYRLQQDLHRLARLREVARATAAAVPGDGGRLAPVIDTVMARLADDAPAILGSDARDRGSFFRDLVGARFYQLAEEASQRTAFGFERLVAVYDRAILEVENEISSLPFAAALDTALRRSELPRHVCDEIRRRADDATRTKIPIRRMVGTGYGRARLPFEKDCIRSEILCHGLGAHIQFPGTRTVLDIGGQDTKAIRVDERGLVTAFQMNDRCAAGCGRYLGYIADELNLGLHELGPLALEATRPIRITSTCTVFAGMELRDLLAVGERRENILWGLHRAIVLRALSLLARAGGVTPELTFTGGVARNPAARKALSELVGKNYGEQSINVASDSIFAGALGAAAFARRGVPSEDIDDPREETCNACIV